MKNNIIASFKEIIKLYKFHLSFRYVNLSFIEFEEILKVLTVKTLDKLHLDFYIYLHIRINTSTEMQTAFQNKVHKNTKPSSDYLVSADCFTSKKHYCV